MSDDQRPEAAVSTRRPERFGAVALDGGRCAFRVWAPQRTEVAVRLLTTPERVVPLRRQPDGTFAAIVDDVPPGVCYRYRLDGEKERPDPASRWQPEGVHGPSAVDAPARFTWHDDAWRGRPLADLIIYELHVGTFTPAGTLDAIIPHLEMLVELGITAIELMPLAQFPGGRNWGYDGVQIYAVQNTYGGPEGLRRLVDACHQRGLAVLLDVVYNHFGPEGNYLWDYGPYFTSAHQTPWGDGLNLDGRESAAVRRFFVENALMWQRDYHLDGLRLDAIHAILDRSEQHLLSEIAEATRQQERALGRPFHLIAETGYYNPLATLPAARGGYGLDAQWSDDVHHALHVLLTGEQTGYYAPFAGLTDVATAFRHGHVFLPERVGDRLHLERIKEPTTAEGERFVACLQNHDQVGNRMLGERLGHLIGHEASKVAAGLLLLSPFVPLLFMGEEYGEPAPFQYFTSHGDPALVAGVREGRRREFAAFRWQGEPPDPQDEATFRRSTLALERRHQGQHRLLWRLYQRLIQMRRSLAPLASRRLDTREVRVFEDRAALLIRCWAGTEQVLLAFNLNTGRAATTLRLPAGAWRLLLDSAGPEWGDPPRPSTLTEPGGDAPATLSLSATSFCILTPREDHPV